jgi:EAL domain-containing protein (putative c-di-GMP-specific phosphodiesterase class I)
LNQLFIFVHQPLLPFLRNHLNSDLTCLPFDDLLTHQDSNQQSWYEKSAGFWLTDHEWSVLAQTTQVFTKDFETSLQDTMSVRVSMSGSSESKASLADTSPQGELDIDQLSLVDFWRADISRELLSISTDVHQAVTLPEQLKSLLALQDSQCLCLEIQHKAHENYQRVNEQWLDLIAPLRSLAHQLDKSDHRARSLATEVTERAEHARNELSALQLTQGKPPILKNSPCSLRILINEVLETLICPLSWLKPGHDFEVKIDPEMTLRGLSLLVSLIARHENTPSLSLREDAQNPGFALIEILVSQAPSLSDQRKSHVDLTYLRMLAERQGGTFTLQSTISGASRIVWSFPQARKLDSPLAQDEKSTDPQCLIWLIDDEPGVRITVRRWLTHLGYRVEVFEEGPKLLEALTQSGTPLPALIVCDADMPIMNGLEVLAKVAKEAPQIKRLLYTAREPNRWVIEAFNQGVIHRFIDKGEGPKALQTCLGEMLHEQEEQGRQLQALDELLSQQLITLHLQPIFNAQTRKIEASEALMRSQHSQFRGPLDILDATQIAQRELDLQRVLTSLSREIREVIPDHIKLFMNIDPVVFGQPEHLDDVFSEVYPYASSIVLELTERGQLCGDAWVESVSRLRERGFEIALDDLGAGYNSLGAVAAVSPEIIKLDISLVSNLHLSQPKREMVRLLSEYAQRHQIKTVAEGIELREEADACTDLGIRWLQGYHLERPIPLDRYRSIYVN